MSTEGLLYLTIIVVGRQVRVCLTVQLLLVPLELKDEATESVRTVHLQTCRSPVGPNLGSTGASQMSGLDERETQFFHQVRNDNCQRL